MKEFGDTKREWAVSRLGEHRERAVSLFRYGDLVWDGRKLENLPNDVPEEVRACIQRELDSQWQPVEGAPGWEVRKQENGAVVCRGPMRDVPTWKRREVEALYREKNPEWRVEWDPKFYFGPVARVWHGDTHKGWIGNDDESASFQGLPDEQKQAARAKFRENYQLRRDELWFQGMPVRMEFGEDNSLGAPGECSVKAWCAKSTGASWSDEGEYTREEWCRSDRHLVWADESERLEAHDRMRRFFYEEHPGKCLCPKGQPLTFELRGGEGVAVNGNGGVRLKATGYVNEFWVEEQKKLRAWTEAQIKKREGEKVVLTGRVSEFVGAGYSSPRIKIDMAGDDWPESIHGVHQMRRVKVTIEPLGGESPK